MSVQAQHTYIDQYCERTGPEFWNEPLNAFTNLSFIFAAVFLYLYAQKSGKANWKIFTLIGILTCIGAGSFLFHTLATPLANLADVLPILLFQIAYIALYSRDVIKLTPPKTAGLLAIFFALTVAFGMLPQGWLNGSLGYAPALLFLIGFGIYHAQHSSQERPILLLAAGIFVLSLVFRSIDNAICPDVPIGVHFLWHILNGVVLYLTGRGYMNGRA